MLFCEATWPRLLTHRLLSINVIWRLPHPIDQNHAKKGDPGLRIAARQTPRVCVEHREINASGRCIQVPSEGCTEATLILRKLPNPKLYTSTRNASKSQAPPLLQSFHWAAVRLRLKAPCVSSSSQRGKFKLSWVGWPKCLGFVTPAPSTLRAKIKRDWASWGTAGTDGLGMNIKHERLWVNAWLEAR